MGDAAGNSGANPGLCRDSQLFSSQHPKQPQLLRVPGEWVPVFALWALGKPRLGPSFSMALGFLALDGGVGGNIAIHRSKHPAAMSSAARGSQTRSNHPGWIRAMIKMRSCGRAG